MGCLDLLAARMDFDFSNRSAGTIGRSIQRLRQATSTSTVICGTPGNRTSRNRITQRLSDAGFPGYSLEQPMSHNPDARKHRDFREVSVPLNSTNPVKLCLTSGLSIEAGDGVMHCRRLFSFSPKIFTGFYKGKRTLSLSHANLLVSK